MKRSRRFRSALLSRWRALVPALGFALALTLAIALTPPPVAAQTGNTVTIRFPGVPSGTCSPVSFAVNDATGDFYDCKAGVWTLVGSGAVTPASISAVGPVYTVAPGVNGFVCNGSTDDSAAMTALLTTVYNAGGGILWTPPNTTCLFSSAEFTLPNNGLTVPNQPSIEIWGAGEAGNYTAGATLSPANASIWNMTYNATDAKLVSLGAGVLHIHGMVLEDTGSDCATFILDTNTTLQAEQNEFWGTASGTSACNDGIKLGGTGTTVGGLVSSPFQGYHTDIHDNYFGQIKRAVFGQTYVNAVQIHDNTVAPSSGNSAGGAFEFTGVSAGYVTGNMIHDNLIEVVNYKYGVNFTAYAEGNYIADNACYDPTATHTACINFGSSTTVYNYVLAGFYNNAYAGYQDTNGTNTFMTSSQSQTSVVAQPIQFAGTASQSTTNSINFWQGTRSDTSDSFYRNLIVSSPGPLRIEDYWNPGGAGAENYFIAERTTSTTSHMRFGTVGDDTTTFIEATAGSDAKFASNGSGNVAWWCGGSEVCHLYANASGQLDSNLSTGTAPFVITSTTPVANLTTVPTSYNHSGTQLTGAHIVEDSCVLGTSCAVTLTAPAAFTSSTSYTVVAMDDTGINAISVSQASGTAFTITGTGTDTIRYVAIGN